MEKIKRYAVASGVAGVLTFAGFDVAQGVVNDRNDDCQKIENTDERDVCFNEAKNFENTLNILAFGGLVLTAYGVAQIYREANSV